MPVPDAAVIGDLCKNCRIQPNRQKLERGLNSDAKRSGVQNMSVSKRVPLVPSLTSLQLRELTSKGDKVENRAKKQAVLLDKHTWHRSYDFKPFPASLALNTE